jgi:hypothetical protein
MVSTGGFGEERKILLFLKKKKQKDFYFFGLGGLAGWYGHAD